MLSTNNFTKGQISIKFFKKPREPIMYMAMFSVLAIELCEQNKKTLPSLEKANT